jgi:hypothetical protein
VDISVDSVSLLKGQYRLSLAGYNPPAAPGEPPGQNPSDADMGSFLALYAAGVRESVRLHTNLGKSFNENVFLPLYNKKNSFEFPPYTVSVKLRNRGPVQHLSSVLRIQIRF